jgi:hypothetical protein
MIEFFLVGWGVGCFLTRENKNESADNGANTRNQYEKLGAGKLVNILHVFSPYMIKVNKYGNLEGNRTQPKAPA